MNDSAARPGRFARNSLDLVRLAAASQVLFVHTLAEVPGIRRGNIFELLRLFPGVPIFFFISGFVISASWERNSDLRQYVIARFMRIYPPLIATFLVSLTLLLLLYDRDVLGNNRSGLLIWSASALTVPLYNPDFLRGYGTGAMNGSLWTIPVELCFYVCVPLLFGATRQPQRAMVRLGTVMLVSLSLNTYFHYFFPVVSPADRLISKIATISPISTAVWIWMFCFGAIVQQNFEKLQSHIERGLLPLLLTSAAVTLVSLRYEVPGVLRPWGNHMGLLNFVALALSVLSFSYRFPDLSRRLLRGNDLSYGLYVFHFPVLNAYLEAGWEGPSCVVASAATAYVAAALCWFLIEKPAAQLSQRWRSQVQRSQAPLAASQEPA